MLFCCFFSIYVGQRLSPSIGPTVHLGFTPLTETFINKTSHPGNIEGEKIAVKLRFSMIDAVTLRGKRSSHKGVGG